VFRAGLAAYRVVRFEPPAFVSYLLSFRRAPSQALSAWSAGPAAAGAELVLFVHFDPAGAVAARVLYTLDRLREAGLDVLFVSNAERLRPEAEAALRARCAGILLRRNLGYDFGAMREGLLHWRDAVARARLLLIMNDSVLGPFAPLRPLLDRIDFASADFWGATDSIQRAPHVQTWFLAAGRSVLDSPAWRRFWAGVRPVRDKQWVISHYEVGLSRALRRAGLRVAALFPYSMLVDRALHAPPPGESEAALRQHARLRLLLQRRYIPNPTADFWRVLLRAGCPFVKRELVERNPARVRDAAEWRAAVRACCGVDAEPP
jgi:hypothetical protein